MPSKPAVAASCVASFAAVLALLRVPMGCGAASPPPQVTGTPGGIRYAIGGDSRDDSSHVVPWAFAEAKARGASAFIFLGDMELTPALDSHFQHELALLDPIPFYPALGNHEVKVFGEVPVLHAQAEKAFRDRFLGTPRTPVSSSLPNKVVYSVNLPGGVHFIALDNCSQNGFGADQLDWLSKDLITARQNAAVRYIIVGLHKPLARNGVTPHSMDADGPQAVSDSNAALAAMQAAKVDLLVASHMHEFLHFNQGGIDAYISGGLGAPLSAAPPKAAFHHFLDVHVTDQGLHVEVVRFGGKPSLGPEEPGE